MARSGGSDRHGWINSGVVATRFGDFEFANGYPTASAAAALREQLVINRAVEAYLAHVPAVGVMSERHGLEDFGARRSNQVVIWESLMDAQTLLLTANTETVYAIAYLYLNEDGPTVVEVPPKMLGLAMDMLQRYLVDFGVLGPDRGQGGKYLFLPPGYDGPVPEGYFEVRSPTCGVSYGMRGFLVDGKPDEAVALMKQLKVYPLAQADNPPDMEFLNGSGQPIDTIHADTIEFFQHLHQIVQEEPAELFSPTERFYLQAIGIVKGAPFPSDPARVALLGEASRTASAFARVNTFASDDPSTYYYEGRHWQAVSGVPYTFIRDGILQLDLRAFVYYMALGNSPAMMAKNVGVGSQYLWTYRDSDSDFLDGAQTYKLSVPPGVPINNFWSVLVYDALSRSELRNSQRFPSVSMFGNPTQNPDDTTDIYFGPTMPPGQEHNWIETLPKRGWFPIFRFYGPLEPFFDKTWQLPDIAKAT
jgi:hypothetical protein